MELSKAYFFGLTLSLTIGPISFIIAQRAIAKGLKSALLTSFGVALADGTLAFIAFSIGASVLLFVRDYKPIVYALSGSVLLALGISIFTSAYISFREKKVPAAVKAYGKDFVSAYFLTIHNPLTIAIFLGFIGNISNLGSLFSVMVYSVMVFLGSCTGQCSIGFISYNLRKFFKSPTAIFTMNVVSSVIMVIFAAMSFVKLL